MSRFSLVSRVVVLVLLALLAVPTTQVAAAPLVDLTLLTGGAGSGTISHSPFGGGVQGPPQYLPGTVATVIPHAAAGSIFTGWYVDGVYQGWAKSLTITMDTGHTIKAMFAPAPAFSDVPIGQPYTYPVVQLAARGTIRGYGDGRFGPDDTTLRAQMAALIARAMPSTVDNATCVHLTWDCESWTAPFQDQSGIDPILWRNVGTLAHYGVAKGYDPAHFGPNDPVTHAQTISYITRAMVAKGYWQQRPTNPNLFGGIL